MTLEMILGRVFMQLSLTGQLSMNGYPRLRILFGVERG